MHSSKQLESYLLSNIYHYVISIDFTPYIQVIEFPALANIATNICEFDQLKLKNRVKLFSIYDTVGSISQVFMIV